MAKRNTTRKGRTMNAATIPERIRAWVEREFNAKYWDCVTTDLIDVATGNRPGNKFEREALKRIL